MICTFGIISNFDFCFLSFDQLRDIFLQIKEFIEIWSIF